MPTKVYSKLCTAFDSRCKRISEECLREKMVRVLIQLTGDLRLRSQQLNMIPLLWTLYLQSSAMSTAARDSLHAAGMTVTPATMLRYFNLVGSAYNALILQVCCGRVSCAHYGVFHILFSWPTDVFAFPNACCLLCQHLPSLDEFVVFVGADNINREESKNFQRQNQHTRFDGTLANVFISLRVENNGGLSNEEPVVSLDDAQPEHMMPSADTVRRLEESLRQLMAGVRCAIQIMFLKLLLAFLWSPRTDAFVFIFVCFSDLPEVDGRIKPRKVV